MKISGSSNIANYIKNKALAETIPSPKRGEPKPPVEREDRATTVSLSQRSREILRAQELIKSATDVRKELVDSVRAKLDDGSYHLDFDQMAEKVLKEYR